MRGPDVLNMRGPDEVTSARVKKILISIMITIFRNL
jgi:hypothetical protein